MAKNEGSVCLNHPDVPASFRCAVCGKPICSECAIKEGGLTYCSQKCRADAIRTGAMVDAVAAKKNSGKLKRAIIRLIGLIILVAAVAGGYYY
ncbi:MAG: B-box zinc finger protein, partial [Victivallales bacterium]|nr:B-box zinc finger protein [Victivallales bacterium]